MKLTDDQVWVAGEVVAIDLDDSQVTVIHCVLCGAMHGQFRVWTVKRTLLLLQVDQRILTSTLPLIGTVFMLIQVSMHVFRISFPCKQHPDSHDPKHGAI